MDESQFSRLLREDMANRWRMFWCNMAVTAAGVLSLSVVFYQTTRSDLRTILVALESVHHTQTSSGNSVHISSQRTVEDNAREILRKQGFIE